MLESQELAIARQAARAGADIVTRYFREGVTIRSKDTSNLVSDADVESEQAIADVILSAYPDHVILGEETHAGDVKSEHLWIVDPLDGTNNFAHRIPRFAVCVAYYHHGVPQCGVICNPLYDDWYLAVRGQGAWYNGTRVHVSPSDQLSQEMVGVGFYYDRGAMMEATLSAIRELFGHHIHGIRRFGTASLDLCMVGCGHFGAFFEYELAVWDFAAGRLFVEEAGGRVTTCAGEDLPLETSTLLASNGKLHAIVLDIVKRHMPQT